MKQVASHFGGTRNAMALSWPKKIRDAGGLRQQFHHVIDLVPTIYELVGIEAPTHVNGIEQMPIHGTSMAYSFDNASAPSTHTTQYFEILGNRAIYHEGWMASCFHGRLPWIRFQGMDFDGPQEVWELYNISEDFSQAINLADKFPEKLVELQELFHQNAIQYDIYPLRDAGSPRNGEFAVPHSLDGINKVTYTRAHVRMPESSVLNVKNCSWKMTAEIVVPEGGAHGVIACQGGNMAGWSLYIDESGKPTYHYNWLGHVHSVVGDSQALKAGSHEIVVDFAYDGGFGAGGVATLFVDDREAGSIRIEKTVPLVYSMSGETFDIGVDTGSPVGNYPHLFTCTADIVGVTIERLDEPSAATKQKMREGEFKASISTQ